MTDQLDLLAYGRQLRDEGIRRTTDASDSQDVAVVDQAIRVVAARGVPFTANDVRELLPPLRSRNLIGGRFRTLATRGEIEKTGRYVPSTDPGTHAHPVCEWQTTNPLVGEFLERPTCSACRGTGELVWVDANGDSREFETCMRCNGTGALQ